MKKLIAVVVMALGAAAFAQGEPKDNAGAMKQSQTASHSMTTSKSTNGAKASMPEHMTGMMPAAVTKEDRKGLDAMWKTFGQAFMKRDFSAAAAVVDFPVLMVTDDGKGNVSTAVWNHDDWVNNMQKAMAKMPMPKQGHPMPMMRHHYDFLTNDIAVTTTTTRMRMGKSSMSMKSSALAVLQNGKWMIKSMAEGGWGNLIGAQAAQ